MARAVQLDLFEGDLDGVYQKLYVAYSENGNFFEIEPHCLSWKTLANKSQIPDFQETKYKHVDTTRMQKLHEYMEVKQTWDIDDIVAENKAYIENIKRINQSKPKQINENQLWDELVILNTACHHPMEHPEQFDLNQRLARLDYLKYQIYLWNNDQGNKHYPDVELKSAKSFIEKYGSQIISQDQIVDHKPGYIKETFKVTESTILTDMKVGDRNITHTKLTDIKDQEVLLVSKSDAYGHYRKIAQGEIVTATYHNSDMNVKNGQRIMKAINVQNARNNEYEAFIKKEPFPKQELSMSQARK